ncbi:hypothetical protein BDF19DRAFT_465481 [Syncephalis fuscata]|nr:hypothetical protein BDF19DRAFT_465481 [Syncephalis fuscata]
MASMDIDTPAHSAFVQLPKKVLQHITQYVSAHDVCQLSQTCHSLCWLAKDNTVWHRKYTDIYGDLYALRRCLSKAGLVLSKEAEIESVAWWQRYSERYQVARDVDHDEMAEEEQAHNAVERVREDLQQFQSSADISILQRSAETLIELLEHFPQSGDCYHLLSFICFILNAFDPALCVLSMGRAIMDDDYPPMDELEGEITQLLDKAEGQDVPLLQGQQLSPELIHVLTCIFEKFDNDGDQHWSAQELNVFITASNGQPAPTTFIRQFISNYGESMGRLTIDGFLSFFLQQTLDDPEETRQDLVKHGWDGNTLQLISDE